jgi:hypothetical protein
VVAVELGELNSGQILYKVLYDPPASALYFHSHYLDHCIPTWSFIMFSFWLSIHIPAHDGKVKNLKCSIPMKMTRLQVYIFSVLGYFSGSQLVITFNS